MRSHPGFPRWSVAALAAMLVFAGVALPFAAPAAAQPAPIDPAVLSDLLTASTGRATFVVVLRDQAELGGAAAIADWTARGQAVVDRLRVAATRSQPALLSRMAQRGLADHTTSVQPFWITNVVVVEGDRQAVEMLAHDPAVAAVMPAPKMAPLRLAAGDAPETVCNPLTDVWGLPRIGAPGVWAAPYHATGAGIVVGVVDTGVQWNHPALQGQYRGWNAGAGTVDHNYSWINPADLCDDSSTGTCDADYHVGPPYPDGHGTQQPTTPSMPFPRTSTRPAAARGAFTPSRRPATVL